ncbi:MAG: HEAT repeat domain-containing protein [Planctomycetota bacterium]|nr:MAG: HEAT repeat domain-containing protein [Planctomycetota bacterium]
MKRPKLKADPAVSRNMHFLYVTVLCDAVFIAAAAILSAFFPIYYTAAKIKLGEDIFSEKNPAALIPEPAQILNLGLFIFLIAGIFFAFPFSIVVNRLSLVASSGHEQRMVPLSRPARWGKTLLGWRGGVFLACLIFAFLSLSSLRPVYYTSTFTGYVPGLSSWRPLRVRLWTALKLYENPKPGIRESLAEAAAYDDNPDVRFIAALTLGGLKDNRAVGPLIDSFNNVKYWRTQKKIRRLLIQLDSPDMIRRLHAAFNRTGMGDPSATWLSDLIILRGGDFLRGKLEGCMRSGQGYVMGEEIEKNWDKFSGTVGTDLNNSAYVDELVGDLLVYHMAKTRWLRRIRR